MIDIDAHSNPLLFALPVFAAIFLYGYNLYVNLISLLGIGICTFYLATHFLNSSDARSWHIDSVIKWFGLTDALQNTSITESNCSHIDAAYTQLKPWNGITLPNELNSAVQQFIDSLIEHYVHRWYKAEISADNTFLLELKYQIRFGSATALRALHNYDFVGLIQKELLPLILMHVNRVRAFLESNDEGTVNVEEQLRNVFPNDLHIAMLSSDNADNYMRQIADLLVERLLDGSRISGKEIDSEAPTLYSTTNWPSESCRHFLRELVLSTVLQPTLEFITNPDTLNHLVVMALDDSKIDSNMNKDDRVPFLEDLGKYCQTDAPDSLLVLKLSDLIRDSRLLQSFHIYMRDVNGPKKWLDCFLHTNHILQRLRSITDNTSSKFQEVSSDAWQLYSNFVHESAKAQIELFSVDLVASFNHAIESRSPSFLLKVMEEVYMILYHELNYNFVLPFCQSESYLGYLCGRSAGAEDLFDEGEQQKPIASAESSVGATITQIPTKIWSMLRGDFNDDELTDSSQDQAPKSDATRSTNLELKTDEIEDENKRIEALDSSFLDVEECSLEAAIDMTQWKIAIPTVERRRRFKSGKIYHVYIVTIERHDTKLDQQLDSQCCSLTGTPAKKIFERRQNSNAVQLDDEDDASDIEDEFEQQVEEYEVMSRLPKAWSIARSYDEFYAFDRRLRSMFASNAQRFALLPDRKMMCERSKQFLEANRKHMETFLQQLTRQADLKQSDLLFAFLTNPGESGFETSIISPDEFNAAQQAKRESDDGEYLKPFISRLLAKALTEEEFTPTALVEEHARIETNSLDSGTYSLLSGAANVDEAQENTLFSKLPLNNPHLCYPRLLLQNAENPPHDQLQALSTFQRLSGNISTLAAYFLSLLVQPHEYLKSSFLTLVDSFSGILNRLFGRALEGSMEVILDETTILHVVKALHQVVFDENREELTPEEIRRNAELAERLLNRWLQPKILPQLSESAADRLRLTIHQIFTCFQHVALNRQLAFVLIDTITQQILPPDAEAILRQLQSDLKGPLES